MSRRDYSLSLFDKPWFLNVVCDGNWKELTFNDQEKTVMRWAVPMCGKNIKMPPMTQTLGFWIDPTVNKSHHRDMIIDMIGKLDDYKNIDLMLHPENDYFLPFVWSGFKVTPRVTYRFNDLSDMEIVRGKYNKGIKRNLNIAKKKVKIIEENNVDNLYNVLIETFKAQNRKYPYNKEFVDKLFKVAIENEAGRIFTAIDDDGNVHASALIMYDEEVAYYLIAGSDKRFNNSKAATLVLDQAIEFASSVSKKFDFEGSMIKGIEDFFRRFGAERVVYYHITRKGLISEILDLIKPKIKRILGYKV